MEKKSTFYVRAVACGALTLTSLFISSFTTKSYAQVACPNSLVLFSETFGTGTTATSSPDVLPAGLTYQETGSLGAEGTYRIINSTHQKPEWHTAVNHTAGDVDGKMLVANGQAETFYSHQIDRAQGFVPGIYIASLYVMNVDTVGICGAGALVPNVTFRVEYLSQGGTWTPLTGSPYAAPPVGQSIDPTWVPLGSSFTLPSTDAFLITSVRIVLSDGTIGGCGNDFALDDINFSQCPEGGVTPVTFLNISARQKGSGVSVEWTTSQELNNDHYDIERSLDGNFNWTPVATLKGAGNSSSVKTYNVYDSKPVPGANFYRIKQVDVDGRFKYSKTVNVKISITKTGVSVLTNPFHNSLTVDFLSATEEVVNAKLIDITGKQVANEKWSISKGSSRKDLSNVNALQKGMYILSVSNVAGEILYNSKVIKQ